LNGFGVMNPYTTDLGRGSDLSQRLTIKKRTKPAGASMMGGSARTNNKAMKMMGFPKKKTEQVAGDIPVQIDQGSVDMSGAINVTNPAQQGAPDQAIPNPASTHKTLAELMTGKTKDNVGHTPAPADFLMKVKDKSGQPNANPFSAYPSQAGKKGADPAASGYSWNAQLGGWWISWKGPSSLIKPENKPEWNSWIPTQNVAQTKVNIAKVSYIPDVAMQSGERVVGAPVARSIGGFVTDNTRAGNTNLPYTTPHATLNLMNKVSGVPIASQYNR